MSTTTAPPRPVPGYPHPVVARWAGGLALAHVVRDARRLRARGRGVASSTARPPPRSSTPSPTSRMTRTLAGGYVESLAFIVLVPALVLVAQRVLASYRPRPTRLAHVPRPRRRLRRQHPRRRLPARGGRPLRRTSRRRRRHHRDGQRHPQLRLRAAGGALGRDGRWPSASPHWPSSSTPAGSVGAAWRSVSSAWRSPRSRTTRSRSRLADLVGRHGRGAAAREETSSTDAREARPGAP